MDQQTQQKPRKAKRPSLTPEQRKEKRRTNFLTRVPKRVNAVIHNMNKLRMFANRAYYSYTDEEAQRIIGALSDALTEVQDAFAQKSSGKTLFSL